VKRIDSFRDYNLHLLVTIEMGAALIEILIGDDAAIVSLNRGG